MSGVYSPRLFDKKGHCWPNMAQHMSNEKTGPGCSGYLGDDILPSYVGIILNHIVTSVVVNG